jgi:ATP-dependent RNA helicase YTHDC2
LSPHSVKILKNFLVQNSWNPAKNINVTRNIDTKTFISSFLLNPPSVPERNFQRDTNILHIRRNLPIYEFKDEILSVIEENRVILIQGSTGSGKTTQIPQYILDDAFDRKKPCRILCTQPRRISAMSSAERVCYERGVQLSSSVGYQIRLDSKISSSTSCVFLTPGIFLRYLMSGHPEKLFSSITHILIDEAHERNKENDFLLTAIKENFNVNPNLKLLIMSATMNTSVFSNYFGESKEVSIVMKQYNVEEFYLEDVLKVIGFHNDKVAELNHKYRTGQLIQASHSAYVNEFQNVDHSYELDEEIVTYLDEIFESMSCSEENPESFFEQFFYLVQNENISINHRHSQTKMTALMIAVGRGWIEMIESLLKIKADPNLKVQFGDREMNSIDIAGELFDFLYSFINFNK